MQQPLAKWNPARDVWEQAAGQESMFCGHLDVFSETFPTSGMTVNGVAYQLPPWEHRTHGTASSSSLPDEMFRTPLAQEGEKASFGVSAQARIGQGRQPWLTNQIADLALLRTPTASEVGGGMMHPDRCKAENKTLRLASQMVELANPGQLLPTPVAQPSGNTPEDHLRKKPGRKVVTDLSILVENNLLETGGKLLPTPKSGDGEFATGTTSGRPVEKSTHLGTIAMLQAGHLEHRRTGEPMPRLFVDGKPCEEPPLPLQS